MGKITAANSHFSDVTDRLQQNLDECYFAMLGLDRCLDSHFGPDPDERMTRDEADEYIQSWSQTIDDLDSAAHELNKMQVYYYQRLHWPEHTPETPEAILKHGRLIVTFAIHRALWIENAIKEQDQEKLAKVIGGVRLPYAEIAREIGASAAAVAHWHKINPLPNSSSLIHKLVEFYGLSDSSEAYYWITKGGVLLPYRMIADYRG